MEYTPAPDQFQQPITASPAQLNNQETMHSSARLTWVLVAVLAVALAGIGGYLVAQARFSNQNQEQELSQPVTTPTSLPTSPAALITPVTQNQNITSPTPKALPAGWQTVSMPTVRLRFALPPQVLKLGTFKEELVSSENEGSMLCVQFVKPTSFQLVPVAHAGGGCMTVKNPYLYAASTSSDYAFGRALSFIDLQGFKKLDQNSYAVTFRDKEFSLDTFIVTEITSQHGISMLKVKGQGVDEANRGPNLQTELDKGTGLIIKSSVDTYPALSIVFPEDGLTADEINTFIDSVEKMQ